MWGQFGLNRWQMLHELVIRVVIRPRTRWRLHAVAQEHFVSARHRPVNFDQARRHRTV